MVPDVVGNHAQANLEVWDVFSNGTSGGVIVEMTTPIVYCATNWIVALAFPHHQLHRDATNLRSDPPGTAGCEYR